ncbi:MAG: alanine racemase [Acidimicrobiia bacterium]
MTLDAATRSVWSEIDLDAVRANVTTLRTLAAPAEFLAVVKANAYGHGAVPVARAALEAGAGWLGVARVEEGVQLRDAGIDARIMLLSEPAPAAVPDVVAHDITPVVYTEAGIDALAKGVVDSGRTRPLPVHLKVDTGMHRVGCTPADAVALARLVAGRDELELTGVCTHLAVADEPDDSYTPEQLDRFEAVLAALDDAGLLPPLVHAANSAGMLVHPRAHHTLVRVGIAMYGLPPAPALHGHRDVVLHPVMSLRARVTMVKELPAGARVSYGLRYELDRPSRIATVPAGYADGVPRNLGLQGGEVLIGGQRLPIAGVVTMDQLLVDVGDAPVEAGDEVVLIGRQGSEEITATEWAQHLGTINYEIVTGIGARVPRTYRGERTA